MLALGRSDTAGHRITTHFSEQWGGSEAERSVSFDFFPREMNKKGQLKWGKRVGRATHTVREKYPPLIC